MSQREITPRKPSIASPYHIVFKWLSNEPRPRFRGQIAEGFRRPPPRYSFRGRTAPPAAPPRLSRKIWSRARHPSRSTRPRRVPCAPEKRAVAIRCTKSGSIRLGPIRSSRRRRSHCGSRERSRAVAAPRHQRHRRHPAHQSRPRSALRQPPLRRSRRPPPATRISNTISRAANAASATYTPARLLAELVGAEAAIVVNNNAAAVFLVLNTLAKDAEVIVSRGELIEIGDGFPHPGHHVRKRRASCAKSAPPIARAFATTNAPSPNARVCCCACILRISASPDSPSALRSTESGRARRALSVSRFTKISAPAASPIFHGQRHRGACSRARAAKPDASVITFSGDKLLGGPQAGIIAGKKEIVERIRRNPLFRALRVDKLTIAALEATLQSYLRGALDEIPALRMIRDIAAGNPGPRQAILRKSARLHCRGAAAA